MGHIFHLSFGNYSTATYGFKKIPGSGDVLLP